MIINNHLYGSIFASALFIWVVSFVVDTFEFDHFRLGHLNVFVCRTSCRVLEAEIVDSVTDCALKMKKTIKYLQDFEMFKIRLRKMMAAEPFVCLWCIYFTTKFSDIFRK